MIISIALKILYLHFKAKTKINWPIHLKFYSQELLTVYNQTVNFKLYIIFTLIDLYGIYTIPI